MQQYLTRINIARFLVLFGFIVGLRSIYYTWAHIGNDLFLLTSDSPLALTHSWHHFFREIFGDFGAMIGVLILLWLPQNHRVPMTWWVMLVLLLGFYAPFWVGTPFMIELAAPTLGAEIQHLIMALPPIIALFVVRKDFYKQL
tara:strand:+ start:213 stop:641 length:429 start_codon:yes stop_codon:yes gene_type:complete